MAILTSKHYQQKLQGYMKKMSDHTFQFEKFIQDLEVRERANAERIKQLSEQEEQCQNRTLVRRYREHVHNRMRVGHKK